MGWSQFEENRWNGYILSFRLIDINGSPSVYVTLNSHNSDSLLVSFHGGPDSLDWDDIRYGGLYRNLVLGGTDILIVNYEGSHGFGSTHQRRAWQSWVPTLIELGCEIQLFKNNYNHLKILGVSFGAWAGLIASNKIEHDRIILTSPVIRLFNHIFRHRHDQEINS